MPGRRTGTDLTPEATAARKPVRLGAAALGGRPGITAPRRARAPTFRRAPRNRKWPGPRRRDQAKRKSLREAVATARG